jgi:hypothetical protein
MVEQYSQTVKIKVDTEVQNLDSLAEAGESLTALAASFDGDLEDDIDSTAASLNKFGENTAQLQKEFAGLDFNDAAQDTDSLAKFRKAISRTRTELDDLGDSTKSGFSVEAKLDMDQFVSDLEKDIDKKLKDNDQLPAVTPKIADSVTFKNKGKLLGDIKTKVEGFEQLAKGQGALDIHLRIDDDSKIKKDSILDQITDDGFLEVDMKLGSGFDEDNLNNFSRTMDEIIVKGAQVGDSLEQIAESTRETERAFDNSIDPTKGETKAFRELADDADNLAQLKGAVTKRNKALAAASDDSTESVLAERIQVGGFTDDLDLLTEAQKNNLSGRKKARVLAKKLLNTNNNLAKSNNKVSNSARRVRSRLDETRDSLRASSKVADLFEDGLGSLSLNLGAFTLALRNFLTQIPLLLAALGALGAAATAVAGSFIAAAAAIGTVVAAGAVAKAQSLKQEFQGIEETGEALKIIFKEVKRLLVEALQPLIQLEEATSLFERLIVGVAKVVNIFAQEFADNIGVVEELFDMIGGEIVSSMGRLASVMTIMIEELGQDIAAMTGSAINGFANLLHFSTEFFVNIEDGMGTIRQLIDTTKQMAFVGKNVFGGIAPIVDAFGVIVEEAAKIINNLDSSFVSASVTAVVLLVAFDKVSGVVGTLLSLVPALSMSLKRADGSMLSLVRSFSSFLSQHPVLFSGFTSLHQASTGFNDEMALLAARMQIVNGAGSNLNKELRETLYFAINNANSMDEFEDELTSTAIQLDLAESEAEELNKALAQTSIQSRLAAKNMDALNRLDPNTVAARRTGVGIEQDQRRTPLLLGAGKGTQALDKLKDKMKSVGGSAKKTGSSISSTFLGPLSGVTSKAKDAGSSLKQTLDPLQKTDEFRRDSLGKFTGGKKFKFPKIAKIAGPLLSLGGILSSIIAFLGPLIALLLLAGAVFVGVAANIDKIKASLSEFGSAAGAAIKDLGSYLMNTFIRLWNALVPAIEGVMLVVKPLLQLLGFGGGESQSGILTSIVKSTKLLIDAFIFVVGIVADALKFFGGIAGIVITITSLLFNLYRTALVVVANAFAEMIPDSVMSTLNDIKDVLLFIADIPSMIADGVGEISKNLNEEVNKVFENINDSLGFNLIPTIDAGATEGSLDIEEGDLDGTREAIAGIAERKPAEFSYEEYNNTTNNTNVDAQPEDTATISRVVEDAIREANSFGRRTAGGQ